MLRSDASRVALFPLDIGHTDLVLAWRSDPIVSWQLFSQRPPTRSEHLAFLRSLAGNPNRREFVIGLHDGLAIGTVGLSGITAEQAEYGILIGDRNFRGKGYAFEASQAILRYAFEDLSLSRVVLNCFADNLPAMKLYIRLGFETTAEGFRMKDGQNRPTAEMMKRAS